MMRNMLLAVVVVVLLALPVMPTVAQDEALTPNEALVMEWVEASVNPELAGRVAKDLLTSDFVYYGYNNSRAYDLSYFVQMDNGANYLPMTAGCVVKGEHDLVEATYGLIQPYGMQRIERTILFRVENGKIVEAWLGHTL